MAIKKQAKNINITVANEYKLFVGGTLQKNTKSLNIEAVDDKLKLISNKKIVVKGNK